MPTQERLQVLSNAAQGYRTAASAGEHGRRHVATGGTGGLLPREAHRLRGERNPARSLLHARGRVTACPAAMLVPPVLGWLF
jgi:hypothetical protein